MSVFWSAFGLILIAEIADKSRVAGLFLATSFRAPWSVFLGMSLAYALLEAVAVAAGGAMPFFVAPDRLRHGAGTLFILLGAAGILFGEKAEGHARNQLNKFRRWGPFAVSFMAVSLAEIADRTQIAAATLTAETGKPAPVYLGALAALVLLNALTVWAGASIASRISPRLIRIFSGTCFILAGVWMLAAD
ncbi:MAG: TMEM165/GDT1 family protein [Elusimicrobia bacterium]|nr:TMEM165/GDT1 family protein [Elusimicrobiota bacterium]